MNKLNNKTTGPAAARFQMVRIWKPDETQSQLFLK